MKLDAKLNHMKNELSQMLLHSAGESVGIFVSAAMIRQNDPQPLVELFTDPRLNRPGSLRRLQGRCGSGLASQNPAPSTLCRNCARSCKRGIARPPTGSSSRI